MKFPSLFLMALAASSVAAFAQTSASASGTKLYSQLSAALFLPGDDFTEAGGGLIAVGAAFAGHHRVEVEAGFFRSDVKHSDFTMDFIPVLLNYKYSLPIWERLTVHAGVTAGAVYQKLRLSYDMEGKTKSGEAFGLNAGASFSLSERLSLEGAMKVLRINETRYTTDGNVVLLQLGLNFRM